MRLNRTEILAIVERRQQEKAESEARRRAVRETIDADIEAYLSKGGSIQVLPTGAQSINYNTQWSSKGPSAADAGA